MRTVEDFILWEKASRDSIDVKRCYIDLGGDLVTGVLLSQIIFWNLPSEKGSKLRIHREDRWWLAKKRNDWWAECRISPKQFDRSITILRERGLVETRRWKFAGDQAVHVWLNWAAVLEGVTSILTKGQLRTLPPVESQVDRSDTSITETTAETTPEITTNDNDDRPPELDEFEQSLGVMLTPLVADDIKALVKDLPVGWFSAALKVAADRDARNWKFVKKVLENWVAAGEMSIEAPGKRSARRDSGVSLDPAGISHDLGKFTGGKYGHTIDRSMERCIENGIDGPALRSAISRGEVPGDILDWGADERQAFVDTRVPAAEEAGA